MAGFALDSVEWVLYRHVISGLSYTDEKILSIGQHPDNIQHLH